MKADSALSDAVNANTKAIAGVTATVAGIVGTAIPELADAVGTLTGQVGDLDTELSTKVEPELAQVTADTAANTKMLSRHRPGLPGRTVRRPDQRDLNRSRNGGATPSLLGKARQLS